MRVLHICSDFSGSKVHSNLYNALEKYGITQEVYTYFYKKKYEGRNFFKSDITNIHYACVLKKYDRFFYYHKELKVFHDLQKKIDVSSIELSHATTLFSDGGIAYKLYKKYHIPYVVTVRNSDVDIHLRMAYHEWPYVKQILKNAQRIVFISEALKKRFIQHRYIKYFLSEINYKIVVQPNGIDDYWIDNNTKDRIIDPENHKLIYVGVYDKNKNIIRLIDAVFSLKKKYSDIQLTLVGGRGELKTQIKDFADLHQDVVNYKGLVTDKEELRSLYQEHSVFVMPSINETFGLVYIEAISNGLACIYSKGQGIDGMFPKEVGEAVNSKSAKDIERGIDAILSNRKLYNNNCVDLKQFRWDYIAQKYYEMYTNIINE